MNNVDAIISKNQSQTSETNGSAANRINSSRYDLSVGIRVETSCSFVHESLNKLAANPVRDGRKLVADCLSGLRTQCGAVGLCPELFILVVSTAYMKLPLLPQLRSGIESESAERLKCTLPVIISSYRDNIFKENFVGHGAILICMSTHLFDAQPDVDPWSQQNEEITLLDNPS